MDIIDQFLQTAGLILSVIGISSPYPAIEIRDIDVYQKNKLVTIDFYAADLLNNNLKTLLDSGVLMIINLEGSTVQNGKVLYGVHYRKTLAYSSTYKYYKIEGSGRFSSYTDLTNQNGYFSFVCMTNQPDYKGKNFETTLSLTITSEEYPAIGQLWGNKPRIKVKFKL